MSTDIHVQKTNNSLKISNISDHTTIPKQDFIVKSQFGNIGTVKIHLQEHIRFDSIGAEENVIVQILDPPIICQAQNIHSGPYLFTVVIENPNQEILQYKSSKNVQVDIKYRAANRLIIVEISGESIYAPQNYTQIVDFWDPKDPNSLLRIAIILGYDQDHNND